MENQEKKAEVANAALSRLIAGDFLESLGKELGLEVPPDMPYPTQKSRDVVLQKEIINGNARTDILKGENNCEMTLNHGLPNDQDIAHESGPSKVDTIYRNMLESGSIKTKGTSTSDSKSSKFNRENGEDDRKIKSPITHHQDYSSSSSSEEERDRKRSGKFNREKLEEYRKIKTPLTQRQGYSSREEERSRKRSRHHQHRRHDAGSDSFSEDERDQHSSRSKGRKKGSSREKSSGSRIHSKHHKHRRHKSPSRSSHYSMEKDSSHPRKEKKRKE